MKDSVVLVTGATGEVGSELIRVLADKVSTPIVALDRRTHDSLASNVHFIQGDVLDTRVLDEINRKYRIETIYHLARLDIPTMATEIFHANQVVCAGSVGASFAAPYLSRIEKGGEHGLATLESMLKICTASFPNTRLIVMSVRSPEHIKLCAEMGVHAMALKEDLFDDFTETNELTKMIVEKFAEDWSGVTQSELL